MDKKYNGLDRIDLFAQELIAQVSQGKKENINTLLEEMEKKNVVRYLSTKYKDGWFLSLDDKSPYNIDDWENIYANFSYLSTDDARRKWGIANEDDGLLFLISLTFEALREVLYK